MQNNLELASSLENKLLKYADKSVGEAIDKGGSLSAQQVASFTALVRAVKAMNGSQAVDQFENLAKLGGDNQSKKLNPTN